MNRISKEIGTLMKDGKKDEAEAAKEKTYSLKGRDQNYFPINLFLSIMI